MDLQERMLSSATIIDCIYLAQSRVDRECLEELSSNLWLLKTFVLCGKKLHKDSSFDHFLLLTERKVYKFTVGLYGRSDAGKWFIGFIDSLKEEMGDRYVTMLEYTCTPSLMTNEVLEIITSIVEWINRLECTLDSFEKMCPLISLKIQMRFLKSLLQFVTKENAEARTDLLTLSETIVINTAYIIFHSLYVTPDRVSTLSRNWDDEVSTLSRSWVEMVSKVCENMNLQVYEIYVKLSEHFLDDDALLPVIDSLMSMLADNISLETRRGGAIKDHLQELYERFVSLKIILRQIGNLDLKIQKEVADVVSNAAISICSFYQPQMYAEFWHQHLLDKIETFLLKIGDMVPQISIFNSPRTSSYGLVDCILEKLAELANSEAESTAKSHVETIQVELASIRSTLREVVELHDERVEVHILWDRLSEVAFKIENAIDCHAIGHLSNSLSTSFDSIIQEIGNIKAVVLKIEVKETRVRTYSHPPSLTTPSAPNEVIGLEHMQRAVLDRLKGGPQKLRLIAIVGMPGVGKTTLASKVYTHSQLSYHFVAKAWCTISQVLDKKKVLIDLLKQICPATPLNGSEHDLANELRRALKKKRYLIILDDIWNTEAWESLKDSFPDDPEAKGSRIIFTSRYMNVAPCEMLDQEPLVLNPLRKTDSWNLMCSKLFPGQGYDLPPALHGLGKQIVARCGGLPLAIIIVAGLLTNVKVEAWEGILGSFKTEWNCRYTLEFSYRHLPYYLRPCFLYFGLFPEDKVVRVRRLVRMWIAEGFVQKSETSSLEDVAEGYLNILVDRNLIMIAGRRSDGRVKACQIHDLLRDFCLEKAKDEHFFHFAKGSDELYSFKEPPNLRRLLIDCNPEALIESKVYCPHARSLFLRCPGKFYGSMSPTLQFFKLLKVLDLEQINFGRVFPLAIEHLVLLAFLAVRGKHFTIPSWLASLSTLETLILRFEADELLLPGNLWNMQKLNYLRIQNLQYEGGCGVLPTEYLDDSSVLYELESFTGAMIDWSSMEMQLRKFPNIFKLKCVLSGEVNGGEYVDKFVFPDCSSKLELLDMSGSPKLRFGVRFEFASLTNVKKLKLSYLRLYWEIISVIGNQLPSLEVLKLDHLSFEDGHEYTWEMKMGEFPKLRILHLSHMPIQRWIACDDHEFVCFQKLVLSWCRDLVELPSCLESIETLEEILIYDYYFYGTLKDLVTKIEKAQNDWGNSGLKICWTRSRLSY